MRLDVAKDYQQQAMLTALEELIRQGEIALILPHTVVDEFAAYSGLNDHTELRSVVQASRFGIDDVGEPFQLGRSIGKPGELIRR